MNFRIMILHIFVSDIEPFISNDDWLNQFGNIIMMQKPEDMELFPT